MVFFKLSILPSFAGAFTIQSILTYEHECYADTSTLLNLYSNLHYMRPSYIEISQSLNIIIKGWIQVHG